MGIVCSKVLSINKSRQMYVKNRWGENSPVTTLALSCSVLSENSPIKTCQLLYWSGEKNLYQCDAFQNEIRPRENNLFVIPSGQTKKNYTNVG
jgi:hypothetical protein